MINTGDEAVDVSVQTGFEPGSYDNLLPGGDAASVEAAADGRVQLRLGPVSAVAILAR